MKVHCLIIGQGIAGTFLSHELQKAGLSFLVMDNPAGKSSSKIASGIINPVTGRRIVETWLIDDLLATALIAYREMEELLDLQIWKDTRVLDFFPTAQMRLAFLDRMQEGSRFLDMPAEENDWQEFFDYALGYGIIRPAYLVNMAGLIREYRKHLSQSNQVIDEIFNVELLGIVEDGIQYADIRARKIIFCDGINGSENRFFKNLPFAPNKGEALIVEIPGLPAESIYKKGISIVPWQDGLFWVGSSHEWNFDSDGPTATFREKVEGHLRSFCRLPFAVIDHVSGVRPATLERRPFVGFHPQYAQVGIFNGLGTKGCSLAPFFARELAKALACDEPIMPEADVKRFSKVLMRR